ncbi:MAG: DNA polymerase III subunit beta, partial [Deltaproteobacteria bacterium]|nr:DNA polymerase III subunit beta [Deltaproteobacteria bacterium]
MELERFLQIASSIVKPSPFERLNDILIEPNGNECYFTVTNFSQTLRAKINLSLDAEKAFCVNFKTFSSILLMYRSSVALTLKDKTLVAKDEKSHTVFELPTSDKDDFPTRQFKEPDMHFSFEGLPLIVKSTFACSKDDTRAGLQGVRFEKNYVVACDGYRLLRLEMAHFCQRPVVIPKETLVVLSKITSKRVEIRYSSQHVEIRDKDGDWILVSQVYDTYPDWASVIPKIADLYSFTIPNDHLKETISSLLLVAEKKDASITLNIEKDRVTFLKET